MVAKIGNIVGKTS